MCQGISRGAFSFRCGLLEMGSEQGEKLIPCGPAAPLCCLTLIYKNYIYLESRCSVYLGCGIYFTYFTALAFPHIFHH